MEREVRQLTPEEEVSRILGLPLERIECLKEEHNMPVTDPEFHQWFSHVDEQGSPTNALLILEELKMKFERSLFPRESRPELAEPAA